jgi:hypothetical protein
MLKIFHGKAFLIGQEADDQKLWVKGTLKNARNRERPYVREVLQKPVRIKRSSSGESQELSFLHLPFTDYKDCF